MSGPRRNPPRRRSPTWQWQGGCEDRKNALLRTFEQSVALLSIESPRVVLRQFGRVFRLLRCYPLKRRKIEMTLVLAVLQLVLLAVVVILLLRRRQTAEDSRLTTELTTQFARLDARLASVDEHLRSNLAQIRTDISDEAHKGRDAADRAAIALRNEVLSNVNSLGETLRSGLDSFRQDNARASEDLRTAVEAQLGGLTQRFMGFASDNAKQHGENRDSLESRLTELGNQYAAQQDKLRSSVEDRLDRLNRANSDKLEEMRQTVDEKLHATLQTRLTESFGQVTDQRTKVHAGLGEMNTLAA